MMESGTYEIITSAGTLDISDLSHYAVLEIDGFGMPPLTRISEQGPLQHGESDRGYRLTPRVLQVALNLRATSWADLYVRRQELLDYLSPVGDAALSLRFTEPDGVTVRQIDGYCVDGPLFSSKDRKGRNWQKCAFRLKCPDPAWYDPTQQSIRVVGSGGGAGFAFPLAVPWTFGGTTIDTTFVLDYDGSWLEYPEIVAIGPITSLKIEHLESGDKLDFSGITIDTGDYYTIDLRYGHKTIVDSSGSNKISELSTDSDLATWRLNPGTNSIQFTGVSGSEATAVLIRYYKRYLGV